MIDRATDAAAREVARPGRVSANARTFARAAVLVAAPIVWEAALEHAANVEALQRDAIEPRHIKLLESMLVPDADADYYWHARNEAIGNALAAFRAIEATQ